MSAEFMLAVLRVERLRLSTIIADIDVLGVGLKAGMISPTQAVEHLQYMGLISPIAEDVVADQKALVR
jgi:hypothetical protein